MKTTMIAVFGFVSVFASGCYDSYRNYGEDTSPLEICEVQVTTNALDGADVTVDGTPIDGTAELQMGPHTFAATALGYFPASVTVEVDESCAPVELRLLPDLNGDYDLVLDGRTYHRFTLQIRQDEGSEDLIADIWREDTPTSEHPYQHFTGTVSFDRDVHLLSEDSSRLDLWGEWTPPRLSGVARIAGGFNYLSTDEDGDWLAESRP
ncbi:MAG: hypothetical protein ABII19_03780 [Patescibacteria group bacterium]